MPRASLQVPHTPMTPPCFTTEPSITLEVIEAWRHLLIVVGGSSCITDEKDLDLGAVLPGQGTCQARAVIRALTTVGRVIENEQYLQASLRLAGYRQPTGTPLGHPIGEVESLVALLAQQFDRVLGHQAERSTAISDEGYILGQFADALL